MLFNSIEYLFFLPMVLILYWVLPHRSQNRMLLAASYLFYGWWDVRFLFLIALSTSIDYLIGLLVDRDRISARQIAISVGWVTLSTLAFLGVQWPALRYWTTIDVLNYSWFSWQPIAWLTIVLVVVMAIAIPLGKHLVKLTRKQRQRFYIGISICSNLSLLGFFKYFDFFVDSAEELIQVLGGQPELFHLNIILPVGISFYTFQTMSYSLDIYRKKLKATTNFIDFGLFVSFFPQLVAGPIERASHLLPSIIQKRSLTWDMFKRGIFLIFYGLFKKIAIADGVAGSVNSIYNTTGQVTWLDIFTATILFAVQIYCDFSAYSDIARGSAKLMGIELMLNFNLPYFSSNPSEFWRRWHISLSSWLRDYLFIPLGGSHGSTYRTYRNLGITMLLGGLWHGAAWNYVLWGAYQGGILSIHRFFSKNSSIVSTSNIVKILKISVFFMITCYGWLLFRATSFSQIIDFTSILLTDWGNLSLTMKRPQLAALAALPLLIFFELYEFQTKNTRFYADFPVALKAMVFAAMFITLIMGLSNEPTEFIYFQF